MLPLTWQAISTFTLKFQLYQTLPWTLQFHVIVWFSNRILFEKSSIKVFSCIFNKHKMFIEYEISKTSKKTTLDLDFQWNLSVL